MSDFCENQVPFGAFTYVQILNSHSSDMLSVQFSIASYLLLKDTQEIIPSAYHLSSHQLRASLPQVTSSLSNVISQNELLSGELSPPEHEASHKKQTPLGTHLNVLTLKE